MNTPPKAEGLLTITRPPDSELVSAEIERRALDPPCRRDLQLAARIAAMEHVPIPADAVSDGAAMRAFLNATLTDFQRLSLTLLKSRIPIEKLQGQHPDVLRALERADLVVPL